MRKSNIGFRNFINLNYIFNINVEFNNFFNYKGKS